MTKMGIADLVRRLLGRRALLSTPASSAAMAFALSVAVHHSAGAGLTGWAVGLGMDSERGGLIACLLIVALSVAAATLTTRRTGSARLGGLAGFVAIQVVPFLVRAAHTPTTPGLVAHVSVGGVVGQPLAMLALALVVVSVGTAVGQQVRSDLARLRRVLGGRRLIAWPLVVVGMGTVGVGFASASTTLQDGPISAIYDYPAGISATAPPPEADPAPAPVATSSGTAAPSASANATLASTPDPTPAAAAASIASAASPTRTPVHQPEPLPRLDTYSVAGRKVVVYLPAVYNAQPARRFPVVYFLHGFPGNPEQWSGAGAQLMGVIDQLTESRRLPPLIAVMPDGNGDHLSDSEWGNTVQGARIEDWLVRTVVPDVDARYRTLNAQYRGIAGFSAGGFGAVNLAVRHPFVFRWAASWSGLFTARADIFGQTANANSPQLTAPDLPVAQRMPLYLADGEGDVDFQAETTRFVATLRQARWLPLQVDSVPGGHGWEAWRVQMVNSLMWLGTLWGQHPGMYSCGATCHA